MFCHFLFAGVPIPVNSAVTHVINIEGEKWGRGRGRRTGYGCLSVEAETQGSWARKWEGNRAASWHGQNTPTHPVHPGWLGLQHWSWISFSLISSPIEDWSSPRHAGPSAEIWKGVCVCVCVWPTYAPGSCRSRSLVGDLGTSSWVPPWERWLKLWCPLPETSSDQRNGRSHQGGRLHREQQVHRMWVLNREV